MKQNRYIYGLLALVMLLHIPFSVNAQEKSETLEGLNVKALILDHLADSYEWQIVRSDTWDITIPLPVILYSRTTGWHFFLSDRLNHGESTYRGFQIVDDGKYKGKIVERDRSGDISRPLDLSMTRNAASLLISSCLLILIVMGVARAMKRNPMKGKGGFVGMMEIFILMLCDELIKPAVGKDHKRYTPFLLTIFFFIFFNNLLGLVPFFPGGANATGNIAVTLVLALTTFLVVNITGTKEYYKEIFWSDVPVWLKMPLPLMPIIEFIGLFTKPFALMIRLFANIMAGHAIVLGLTSIIFVTASMGSSINASMTVVSMIFTIFIDFLELLVAFIQAYVFTLLSAVFIGLARVTGPENKKNKLPEVAIANKSEINKQV